ncbi:OmpA family protein [Vibrio ostreae]|uniref:OmpA family protein n=1 Tax=Vibrio ostreae TaxID=2841925 RepID=A0A975U7K2_9VIBR|nr:OmpA family protein [Vibrio ostreae]QXO16445.1 OmpA family protein [Vibrio ostreae]
MRLIKQCGVDLWAVVVVFYCPVAYSQDDTQYLDFTTNVTTLNQTVVRQGIEIDLNQLNELQSGQQISEVKKLLGEPVNIDTLTSRYEWEYNIIVPLETNNNHIVCQYKIIFSPQHQIRATQWRRDVCERLFNAALTPQSSANVSQTSSKTNPVTVDVEFEFNQFQLTEAGKLSLDKLVATLSSDYQNPVITLVGYTDYIGASQYNMRLSARRAETVKQYLSAHSIPIQSISTQARGADDPIVQCQGSERTSDVIGCLKPNRRVEVIVTEQL